MILIQLSPTDRFHVFFFNDQFDTKERLCHSTPSGGYCVNGVLSSPSMAVKLLPSQRNAFQAGAFCLDFPLINQQLPGYFHIHNGNMHFKKNTHTHTHIEEGGIWMITWFCSFLSMSTLQHIEFARLYVFCCFVKSAEQRLSRCEVRPTLNIWYAVSSCSDP